MYWCHENVWNEGEPPETNDHDVTSTKNETSVSMGLRRAGQHSGGRANAAVSLARRASREAVALSCFCFSRRNALLKGTSDRR